MSRLIFWIVLIVLVAMAVRSKLRAMSGPPPGHPLGPQPGGARADGQDTAQARVRDESERMACCARCGLYFPASETVSVAGRDYCCAAHAHQAAN